MRKFSLLYDIFRAWKMRDCVWMWILVVELCVMRLTTISKLPWRGPQIHTYVKLHILHFFSFIRKLYWNKQAAAVAAHNKFAQYFFLSHSPPIFSFQKRNKQQPSERFFSLNCNSVHKNVYTNGWNYTNGCCCMSEIFSMLLLLAGAI